VAVKLGGPPANYSLPEPPTGDALARAVYASLSILDTAHDRITCPLLAAVYRAPLGHCGFGLFLLGSLLTGRRSARGHFTGSFSRKRKVSPNTVRPESPGSITPFSVVSAGTASGRLTVSANS